MKIGEIELGKLPVVVGTVSTDLNLPVETLEKVDAFELRVDMFNEQDLPNIVKIINSIKHKYGKPLIITIRSKIEGGILQIDDDKRYQIFKGAIPFVDAIDVELSSTNLISRVFSLYKENKKLLIASYHNFDETPKKDEMEKLIQDGKKIKADIVKIAVKANTKDDLANLITFTIENKDAGLITISMGNIGVISRIINPLIGSLMTYGYIDRVASDGQMSVFDIIEYIRLFDPFYNEELAKRLNVTSSTSLDV